MHSVAASLKVCVMLLCNRHPWTVLYITIGVAVLQVLSFLFTHWNVHFNAWVNYQRVAKLGDAEYIQVGTQRQ